VVVHEKKTARKQIVSERGGKKPHRIGVGDPGCGLKLRKPMLTRSHGRRGGDPAQCRGSRVNLGGLILSQGDSW